MLQCVAARQLRVWSCVAVCCSVLQLRIRPCYSSAYAAHKAFWVQWVSNPSTANTDADTHTNTANTDADTHTNTANWRISTTAHLLVVHIENAR